MKSIRHIIWLITPPIIYNALRAIKKIFVAESGDKVRTRRASKIGLSSDGLKIFLADPDGAVKLNELKLPKIGGLRTRFLKESKAFLIESILDDAYGLEKIELPRDKNITIVDVGANVGAFAIAARAEFPLSTIHCYEMNHNLRDFLGPHTYSSGSKCFFEGVGLTGGYFSLDERQNYGHFGSESVGVVDFSKKGNVPIVSLTLAIERIGGHVDILKLDCEGSEWSILKDVESLKRVIYLTFEYHRLCSDGTFDMFDRSIDIHSLGAEFAKRAGFEVIRQKENSIDAGIILAKHK